MLVKLRAGDGQRVEQLVDIRSAPQDLDELEGTLSPDEKDISDLLVKRQFSIDASDTRRQLTFICQHLFHNDLSPYLAANRSGSALPAAPFLSPVRALRFVRDFVDADALKLHVGAHSELEFALHSASDEHFRSEQSAHELFNAVTECARAVDASDFELAVAAAHSRLGVACDEEPVISPASAWRLEELSVDQPANNSSDPLAQSIPVKADGANNTGLLLQLSIPDSNDRTRDTSNSGVYEARLVFDARALSPNTNHNAFSRVRAFMRPLTIAVVTKTPGEKLLLHLTLIVSVSERVERLGPFKLVCCSYVCSER